MSKTFYKLNYYKPFWTIDNSIVPYDHIETIVSGIEEYVNRAQNSNVSLWEEITTKNLEWVDINTVKARGSVDTLPNYIKVNVNGQIYYYYKLDNGNVMSVDKEKVYYDGIYHLDEYMTYFHHKLQVLYEENPTVYQLFGFDNRWHTRTVGDSTRYVIDYVEQRYLSNTVQDTNNMMVRELAYYTTANDLFSLNFPSITQPSSVSFTNIADATDVLSLNWSVLTGANERGRYEYVVCKPTSLMTSSNSKLINAHTTQQFYIIPLFSSLKNTILQALNDFDITGTHEYVIDAWGDNQIGIYECDIPYSVFYGYQESNLYGVTRHFMRQPLNNDGTLNLPIYYFTVNNNAPMSFKIIDYSKYNTGFYGKFLHFIDNISEWTPETEPALWNPTYYKEVYNNGNSNLVTDASFFVWDWDGTSQQEMGVQAYLSWQENLNIAYNYGDYTNTKLATLDNTQTQSGNLSLANMYFGSASANYFTNNANTIFTGLQSRETEEKQSWANAMLDTASTFNNLAKPSSHIVPWRALLDYIRQGVNADLSIVKNISNTAVDQIRYNRELRSTINNLTSAPATILSNPSTKAVVPNHKYNNTWALFETWALKLHPNDEKVKFINYCHNGYPTNEIKNFQEVFNRKYMNVMHLDTTYFAEDLKYILQHDSDKVFNTPVFNQKFLLWLNEPHKIYNTWWLINCTDYYSSNYVSNVENSLPPTPTSKTHINTLITTLKDVYAWNTILVELRTDNPSAPSSLWNDIEITNISQYGFIIKAKESSTLYKGTIKVNTTVYDGYINDNGTYHYFFGNVDFLCAPSNEPVVYTIICPDGTTYSSINFNLPITFNNTTSFTSIADNFLFCCQAFNQNIAFGNSITKIGDRFMSNCYTFNSIISLPPVQTIGEFFFSNNINFNKNILIPSTATNIAYPFMRGNLLMTSSITLNCSINSFPRMTGTALFDFVVGSLTVPAYTTGTNVVVIASELTAAQTKWPNNTQEAWARNIVWGTH